MEPLTIAIGDEDRVERITLPPLGLRDRAMLIAHRLDSDHTNAAEPARIYSVQRIARLLLSLDPTIRIIGEGEGPTITTSEGLVFGLTPRDLELVLLAYPCPRRRHAGVSVETREVIRDVIDLGRVLNRHDRFCARLEQMERRHEGHA
jgi:hypothetical protein